MRRSSALLVALVLLLSAAAAIAVAKDVSRKERAPISLRIATDFGRDAEDESHPPALKELRIWVDKDLRLDLGEMPACRGSGSRDRIRGGDPFKDCKDSIVARGRMEVEILFPEQSPIWQRSKVAVYKFSAKGRTARATLYTSITVPTPAAIVSMMEIKPIDKGRYGTEMIAEMPKIAGGAGSVTYFALRFSKGVLTATCPRDDRLRLRLKARFADGTSFADTTASPCPPRR
jgi:hypothetical protein